MSEQGTGGLYQPSFGHDGCGFGLIAHMDGQASHRLVRDAIHALSRLTHRGAVAADGRSGDGCGLLMKLPGRFLRKIAAAAGIILSQRYAVGMVFLNTDRGIADSQRRQLESELRQQQLAVAGWRTVPMDTSACGARALATLPLIEQIFVNVPEDIDAGIFWKALIAAWTGSGSPSRGLPVWMPCSTSWNGRRRSAGHLLPLESLL